MLTRTHSKVSRRLAQVSSLTCGCLRVVHVPGQRCLGACRVCHSVMKQVTLA